jgi:hypothetical protein
MANEANHSRSSTPIDVLIPAIEKDLGTLPHTIDGIRKYVRHPIGRIIVISPDSSKIKALCRRKGCHFVNETTVLPITKKDIHYGTKKFERSGWLYQQLLKLGGSSVSSEKFYLTMDADTVLIRPHRFRTVAGKTIFYCRNWSQDEYFRTYRKLLGRNRSAPSSFVTHYMLFERSQVSKLKRTIEAKHRTPWYNAILRSMDKTRNFAFSEFETYGNFLYSQDAGRIVLKKAMNKSLPTSFGKLSSSRIKKLASKYRSLSFHQRKAYSKKSAKR